MRTIQQLIEVYDQPEPADSQSARMTEIFHLQHSQAAVVAETIKDVYRDLLSSHDKALANNPAQRERAATGTTYIFNEGQEEEPGRTQVTFKGKLSVGVDSISNTLIVSAEGESLMRNIRDMIETLRLLSLLPQSRWCRCTAARLRRRLHRLSPRSSPNLPNPSKTPSETAAATVHNRENAAESKMSSKQPQLE